MHNNNTLYIHLKKGEYCYLFVKYRNKIHHFKSGDIIMDWVDYIEFILNLNTNAEIIIDQMFYDYLADNTQYQIMVSNHFTEQLYGKYSRNTLGFITKADMKEPIELKNYIISKKRKTKIISLFDDIR
jgi:hypothetical protein